ncbi:hypothetical protein BC835DRAFT_1318818 [Cytidiella melzeri]|nr:hypothetical protein BC835DRAFT_1318818 [Cytidiella melzeri]
MSAAAFDHAIHFARQSQVNKCAAYSRLALLTYDLVLSASREKELIWQREFRSSSVIYVILRYPVIAFQLFNVVIGHTTIHDCNVLYRFTWAASSIITRLAITVSFMLRVYAMMSLSRTGLVLAGFLGLVGASTIGLDVWQDIQVSCATSSNPLCTWLLRGEIDILFV